MLLRKLLDPEETARRRKLRARIVRRNRIQRELAQGLDPKWRRVPKQSRTVHDYGWDPLQDGTAAAADQKRVENEGNALAFLLQASRNDGDDLSPEGKQRVGGAAVMEGVAQVAPRFANRITTPPDQLDGSQRVSGAGTSLTETTRFKPGAGRPTVAAMPARQVNDRARVRWRDVLQLILIQRHQQVLSKDGNRPWRQERLGLLLFERKKYKDASEHLAKAITLGSSKSVCWRRLAQCHWYSYAETHDWDALWDAKAAFEQALTHLEMACNPYVLYEYARVLEALGSYDSALNACASLLSTFPKFALATQVRVRFVLLQRYQFLSFGSEMDPSEKERGITKCIEMTKALLLERSVVESAQYVLVLYLHVRLNELLYETTAKRGDGPGTVARTAKSSADQSTEELFKTALGLRLVTMVPGVSWRIWWIQSQTYIMWADHLQNMNENIAAADALTRALELMDMAPSSLHVKPQLQPQQHQQQQQKNLRPADLSIDRKIQLYLAMATNYYESNQMERAIRAMETIFQLNPYLETVRQSLAAWFPAKWRDRIELEDASQVQIARVLRGLWGRAVASKRRKEIVRQVEIKYRANPYHPLHRRNVVRWLRNKYAPLFAAQELAARRIQKSARVYLSYARIRRALQAQRDKEIRDLRAKYSTRKYRYNRHVRFYLAQLVPHEFDLKFRREDQATGLVQRWYRGERVRRVYRAQRAAIRARIQRETAATVRIQRVYRQYQQRCHGLLQLQCQQLLFETQRLLQKMREKLAVQLQRLYQQWKNRLVLATRIELKRMQQLKQQTRRQESASRIQRVWRRYVHCVLRNGGKNMSESSLLLDQLKRGHERVLAEDMEDNSQLLPLDMESSARKIQALYRGKRIRASLANITKHLAPVTASEITLLLTHCDRRHAAGEASRIVLSQLESLREKRALFDYAVVVVRPDTKRARLPLTHLTSAIQHSTVLHTLVIDGGDYRSPRAEELFQALQRSKTINAVALRGISTHANKQHRRRSGIVGGSAGRPEDGDDSEDDITDDEEEDDEGDDGDGERQLRPSSSASELVTPMRSLFTALSTKSFLLEQLLLEDCDLLTRPRDGAVLAGIVGDYFYGRYGKLTTLAAQRMALSDTNAALLGPALAINTVLQHLNLSGNEIRDAGATAIAASGLTVNKTLVYLNLADNSIGSAGAKALFSSLATPNRTLKTLILSNNLVMNDAVATLFTALQRNAVVEEVDLRGNLIHQDHVHEIEGALQERVEATSEELRLFLARRRLSTFSGSAAPGGMLSPVRCTGSKAKRRATPLSPQKWIKAQASSKTTATATISGTAPSSIIASPCVVYKSSAAMAAFHKNATHTASSTAINALLLSSPAKKKQKPVHVSTMSTSMLEPTRLPMLATGPSPVKSIQRNQRR